MNWKSQRNTQGNRKMITILLALDTYLGLDLDSEGEGTICPNLQSLLKINFQSIRWNSCQMTLSSIYMIRDMDYILFLDKS